MTGVYPGRSEGQDSPTVHLILLSVCEKFRPERIKLHRHYVSGKFIDFSASCDRVKSWLVTTTQVMYETLIKSIPKKLRVFYNLDLQALRKIFMGC